jgi:ABC-type multidrug transport system fused ATPase/permease subunit
LNKYSSAVLLIYQKRSEYAVYCVAGLAPSNALQMLVFFQWTIRQWGDVETQMSSVGQLVYYGKTKPKVPFQSEPGKKPPASWPHQGLIRFTDIELKYRKLCVSVLINVTMTIYLREMIGIVGRTGSGKSKLSFYKPKVETEVLVITFNNKYSCSWISCYCYQKDKGIC